MMLFLRVSALAVQVLVSQAAAPVEIEVDETQLDGYVENAPSALDALRVSGYLDVGFAKAGGNGTSFQAGDIRAPADYFVDPFSAAVNSRGDVASIDSGGRFTNGFLPRSVGIGGRPSFLLNTASVEARYAPRGVPLFAFVRAQLMPRFSGTADSTRLELQQAFGKLTPFASQEFSVSAGRFDSVFGIEYLDNEAPIRMGITPSLVARYTTGHSLGLKAFYRQQAPSLKSSLSLNVAATNHGTRIEALVPTDASLVGVPVGSGRLGYEFNGEALQVKLGASGLIGPRNDQRSRRSQQWALAGDARVNVFGFALSGEFLRLVDAPGGSLKTTGVAPAELASGFDVWGGWVRLAYVFPIESRRLTQLAVYGRYDRREARFQGLPQVKTDRFTVGVKAQLFEVLALKAEVLFNRELSGAAEVENDVVTSSAVFSF